KPSEGLDEQRHTFSRLVAANEEEAAAHCARLGDLGKRLVERDSIRQPEDPFRWSATLLDQDARQAAAPTLADDDVGRAGVETRDAAQRPRLSVFEPRALVRNHLEPVRVVDRRHALLPWAAQIGGK